MAKKQPEFFEVKTGYGYFVDEEGRIILKCQYLTGKHVQPVGLVYVEVENEVELYKIEIYLTPEQQEERDIQVEIGKIKAEEKEAMRNMAKTRLANKKET